MPRALRHAVRLAIPLLSLVVACQKEPPGYMGPYARQVRKAIPELEESSGLTFKKLPVLEERSRDDVRTYIERQFNEQMSPLELAGTQEAYRLFGLLPDTLDLRRFLEDILTEQVAGYYDPAMKVLYVVRDAAPEIREITIAHELMHALQDQHVRIDSVQSLRGDNDRMVAMQSVLEGQAVYEQFAVMSGGGDVGLRLPAGWDRIREAIRAGQASMPVFANAPMLIQETLLFPYLSGAEFIRQVKGARSGQAAFAPFASSTEQIVHPEKFLDSVPDLPTRITLAAPRGGTLVHEDNLGEFETRLLLYQHLQNEPVARSAAAGWDGDRYQVVNTSAGSALAWITVWDSPVEAAEFRDAMQRLVERRYHVAPRGDRAGNSGGTRASSGSDGAVSADPAGDAAGARDTVDDERRWTASGRRVLLAATTIAGRPVVVYEDAPAATTGRLLVRDRVTLLEP